MVSTLRDSEDVNVPLDPAPMPPNIQHNPLMTHTNEDMARLCETHGDLDSNQNDDEIDNGMFCIGLSFHIMHMMSCHIAYNILYHICILHRMLSRYVT